MSPESFWITTADHLPSGNASSPPESDEGKLRVCDHCRVTKSVLRVGTAVHVSSVVRIPNEEGNQDLQKDAQNDSNPRLLLNRLLLQSWVAESQTQPFAPTV
ncbi:hypothetical protein JMJ77_0014738 [Colletotrichum scovillei]|uniref:Uncharacterized protein n=1 Tax=Colletotrichum scovillei TaxID=1209932 RepID=A0A9P7U8D5_9PEZI|nr:hypothetical protein JMJ77_0014738 [Colletotrichum scovillei]KAG7056343.1 hypothetical protein JMJ78_0000145 [Colletotrichum scovillei]KAG7066279.1 hypothetical protein JMJ76_0000144 [Colletotrichum scovillei]